MFFVLYKSHVCHFSNTKWDHLFASNLVNDRRRFWDVLETPVTHTKGVLGTFFHVMVAPVFLFLHLFGDGGWLQRIVVIFTDVGICEFGLKTGAWEKNKT